MDYPNDGQAYSSDPSIQTEAEQADIARVASATPMLDDLISWFDVQIRSADSLMNIETTKLTINGVKYERSVSIEAQVLANQILKGLLESKKSEYIDFKERINAA